MLAPEVPSLSGRTNTLHIGGVDPPRERHRRRDQLGIGGAEQSGVSQVGEAVGQMDQATQQNAALVEESAAAAESLKLQAQQLVETVAVFRLKG